MLKQTTSLLSVGALVVVTACGQVETGGGVTVDPILNKYGESSPCTDSSGEQGQRVTTYDQSTQTRREECVPDEECEEYIYDTAGFIICIPPYQEQGGSSDRGDDQQPTGYATN